MFSNYLKIALRIIKKNKTYSLINVLGLTIGMTAFLLIVNYVRFEFSYDEFNIKKENVYRVESQFFDGDEMTDDWATSSHGYGPAMKNEFPEILEYARINLWNCERVVSYTDDIKFREKNVYLADSNFISLLTYPLVEGDPKTALVEPNSVVVSESIAKKYFGNLSPMGKLLTLRNSEGEYVCKVTGILKDIPRNSHVQYDMLISWTSISSRWTGIDNFWYQHESYTYVELKPGINPSVVESKFPEMAEKYKTGSALKHLQWTIKLIPITDIHLNTYKSYEREVKGNRTGVWALLIIAFIVLIIAWVNYFNLTTARAIERAKEVGLRKVCGALKKQLITQFLFESAIINISALFFTFIITQLVGSDFVNLTGLTDKVAVSLADPYVWILSIGLVLSGIIFGGLYPARLLASPAPAKILKGKYSNSSSGLFLRKALIVFQFSISIILISGTLLIYEQINFMQNQELGASVDQILVVKTPVAADWSEEKMKAFRDDLISTSSVNNVTVSSSVPGKEVAMFMSNYSVDDINKETKLFEMLRTDYDFIDTYGLKIKYGRNFSRDFETDDDALILSEEAVKLFGFPNDETVIGKEVVLESSDKKFKIIGVSENYHHQSLKLGFKPIIIFMSPSDSWIVKNYFSIKMNGTNLANAVNQVEEKWASFFPSTSFDYFFLDEFFNIQYKADKQFGIVFFLFAGLAIFIACIGLFGLVAFTTKQKTKEIGIRKSIGASVKDIVYLLLKEFIKWVIVANVIALPLAWFIMNGWLEDFAFRIDISNNMWVFVLAGFLTFVITVGTLSTLVVKAAKANPVDSLRNE